MNRIQLSLVGAVSWISLACSSSYEPAKSPRISFVYDGGQPVFVKNGERYHSFIVGNALIDAVAGDPQAEAEAHAARNLQVGGFVLSLGGLGALGSAVAVQANSHPSDAHNGVVGGLVISALAAEMVSLALTFSSIPHFYDAINIYNDDVDRALAPPLLVRVAPPAIPVPAPAPAAPSAPASAAPSAPPVPSAPAPAQTSTPSSAAFPPQ